MKKQTVAPFDKATLEALKKEARKSYLTFKKVFEKHDNYEDMQGMNYWAYVGDWLQEKIDGLGKR